MNAVIQIPSNREIRVKLARATEDSETRFDGDLQRGTYTTTDGDELILPRKAVEALNYLLPIMPGEEVVIVKVWSARILDKPRWEISIPSRGGKMQQKEEAPPEPRREPIKAPIPIRKAPPANPGLFDDRGTGTDGPAPLPAARAYAAPHPTLRRPPGPEAIPADVAFLEISAWVADILKTNGLHWGDEAQKNLVCTVMIAEYKAKRIGPWRRPKC
jgi:hypothetical protein